FHRAPLHGFFDLGGRRRSHQGERGPGVGICRAILPVSGEDVGICDHHPVREEGDQRTRIGAHAFSVFSPVRPAGFPARACRTPADALTSRGTLFLLRPSTLAGCSKLAKAWPASPSTNSSAGVRARTSSVSIATTAAGRSR